MATKRPAKIASKKKGKAAQQDCPCCDSDMQMSKILRTSGASGMYWLCNDTKCNALLTPNGALAGELDLT